MLKFVSKFTDETLTVLKIIKDRNERKSVMAFFQELGNKISQTSQDAVKKTRILAETAKINSHIEGERRNISENYNKIGSKYFELYPETSDENLAGFCNSIAESMRKIEDYQEQIKQLKGITTCQNCGVEFAEGAQFCTACGAKIAIPEETMDEQTEALQVKSCSGCGQQLTEGSIFCSGCGKKAD
jgi:rRNA maturation endonuclease Nob1